MTDNDFADPWGLPSTADDDDVGAEAQAEPPPAPEPVSEPAPEEPVAPDAVPEGDTTPGEPEPTAADEAAVEAHAPEVPAAAETSLPDAPTPIEVTTEEREEPPSDEPSDEESDQAPAASSGPYSQVLAAASGLFGRSTTPAPQTPVEIDGAGDDAEPDVDLDTGDDSQETWEDAVDEIVEETLEDDEVVPISIEDDDTSIDHVEEALSSLGTTTPAEAADIGEEVDIEDDEAPQTVSVEEIAAMASQLEVETPEPFEVSFTTEDDVADVAEEADEVGDAAQALLEADTDEPDISIDMDSAPSVFEELSQAMGEPDVELVTPQEESAVEEPVPGGFDVGAVFHSEQAAAGDEPEVEDMVSDSAEEAIDDFGEDDSTTDAEPVEVSEPASETPAGEYSDSSAAPVSLEEEPAADPFADGVDVEEVTDDEASVDTPTDRAASDSAESVDESAHEPVADAAAATGAVAAASTADTDEEDAAPSRFVDSGEVEWGARWHESAQGWVEDSSGQATWRPIVTTASTLSEWEVDTYLGIVVGDSPVSTGAPMDTAMVLARQHAIRVMVDEALSRGAHAVIGVQLGVADVGSIPLATATGTAVTLKPGDA